MFPICRISSNHRRPPLLRPLLPLDPDELLLEPEEEEDPYEEDELLELLAGAE